MRIPLIIAAALLATPAMAQSITSGQDGKQQEREGRLLIASWLVCVGVDACSMVTDQRCSVVIGDNMQLPEHSGHILATPDGVRPLGYLDGPIVEMIDQEARRMGVPSLSESFIERWNAACTVLNGKPGV